MRFGIVLEGTTDEELYARVLIPTDQVGQTRSRMGKPTKRLSGSQPNALRRQFLLITRDGLGLLGRPSIFSVCPVCLRRLDRTGSKAI